MRYLFWIICGAILIALVITWLVLVPTDEARTTKEKLDQQSRDLKELEKRAARGNPQGVFDAENIADTQRLASEYLITESWKRVLTPHVDKYQKHLGDITGHLLARSAWLHKPVMPTKNKLEWYTAYVSASEALLSRLREAGCARGSTEEDTAMSTGESAEAIRTAVGLYAKPKSGTYPEPHEHPSLTARFRAMELIAERLIAARVAVNVNPVVGPTGTSEDRARASALIANVTWAGASTESDDGLRLLSTAITGQVQPRALGLSLTLEGPLSALLAASAKLEHNAETDRPLIAINGASLARIENLPIGGRFDVADDTVRLVLNLLVIEFADITTLPPPSSGANAPARPNPAPAGLPGAMPPGMMPPGFAPPGMPPTSPPKQGAN